MIEAATVNAISMIMLLRAIEAMYPGKRLIHLFVDNARYHHAKLVQVWLARLRRGRRTSPRPGRRAWSTRLLALFPIRAPRRKYASSDVLAFGTLAAGQAVAWAIPRMQADPLVGRSLTVLELRELVEQIEAAGLPRGLQIYMDGPSGPSSAAFMDG
jgi:hypothetical protein